MVEDGVRVVEVEVVVVEDGIGVVEVEVGDEEDEGSDNEVEGVGDDDVVDGSESVDDTLGEGGRETDLAQTSVMKSSRCFSITLIGKMEFACTINLAAKWCILILRVFVWRMIVLGSGVGGVWLSL